MKREARPSLGRDYWVAKIKEFKASGLSQSKFAIQQGVGLSTLHGWLKRLDSNQGSSKKFKERAVVSKDTTKPPVTFTRIKIAEAAEPQKDYSISWIPMRFIFPGGVSLDVSDRTDLSAVAKILRHVGGPV